MSISLNASDELYSALVSLVGVDDDGVTKDFVTGQACGENASVTHGTGTYGRHFTTSLSGNTALGVTLPAPYPTLPDANPIGFSFVVVNAALSRAGRGSILNVSDGSGCVAPGIYTGDVLGVQSGTSYPDTLGTTALIGTGAHSLAICNSKKSGSAGRWVWVDGVLENSNAAGEGNANDAVLASYIGGAPAGGYGGVAAQYVWVAHFRVVPTTAQVAALHASLGANNAFRLVQGAAAASLAAAGGGSAGGAAALSGVAAALGASGGGSAGGSATLLQGGILTIPARCRQVVNKNKGAWASVGIEFLVIDSTDGSKVASCVTTLDASGALAAYQFQDGSYVQGRTYLVFPVVGGSLAAGTPGHGFPVVAA